ncbi:hypothetical protein Syun_014126 [Stephania yunnanensis]|uniref:Uncharacterized protein n=1 Tax=Stephania yunnanensis TaxID=152371 RepID=A0AAP0JIQ5_9MAGN
MLPSGIVQMIKGIAPPSRHKGVDRALWLFNKSGEFSVKRTYELIEDQESQKSG